MSNTPKLPFYLVVGIIALFNLTVYLFKYLTGTWLVVDGAVSLIASTVAFEYGVSTAITQATSKFIN